MTKIEGILTFPFFSQNVRWHAYCIFLLEHIYTDFTSFIATRFYFTLTRMLFHTDILSLCIAVNKSQKMTGLG